MTCSLSWSPPSMGACALRPLQRGFTMVSTMLMMVVFVWMIGAITSAKIIEERTAQATLQGGALDRLRLAVNDYIQTSWTFLQHGEAVSSNSVRLAPGGAPGETYAPTIDQLIGMGYLPGGFSASAVIGGGSYQVRLDLTPAGCSGAACGVAGLVWIDRPLRRPGSGEMDSLAVGAVIRRIGVDAGHAPNFSPGELRGNGGTWRATNPASGTPAGVVAARVGFGSAAWASFLRVNDTRDPSFRGDLSVAGNVNVGPSGSPCVELQLGGTIHIRCAGALNAATGTFSGPVSAATVTAAGPITGGSLSTAGAVSAGSVYAAGDVSGLSLTTAGLASSNRWRPTGSFAPGTACTEPNAVSSSAIGNGLVLCHAGAWRPIVTQASEGESCSPEGTTATANGKALLCVGGVFTPLTRFAATGTTSNTCAAVGTTAIEAGTGVALLCRANPQGGSAVWHPLNDLVSSYAAVGHFGVSDGAALSKPTCNHTPGSTGVPVIFLMPGAEGSSDGAFDRYVVDNGSSWTVYLRDGAGQVLGGGTAVAQVYCYYQ